MVPAIVTLLGIAAKAYGEELGKSVGEGVVETLFRQQQMARDLDAIKRQIAALSE